MTLDLLGGPAAWPGTDERARMGRRHARDTAHQSWLRPHLWVVTESSITLVYMQIIHLTIDSVLIAVMSVCFSISVSILLMIQGKIPNLVSCSPFVSSCFLFSVSVPLDLDVRVKVLLLASVFVVVSDLQCFESQCGSQLESFLPIEVNC